MKNTSRISLFLCVLLLFASVAGAANDFSGSNAFALWRFENDLTDSIGGNDLTDYNTVGYNNVDYQEGSYSLDLEETDSEQGYLVDGSLDADFPGKNGTSEVSFSICYWVRWETLPAENEWGGVVDKMAANKVSFSAGVQDVSTVAAMSWIIGYNTGINWTTLRHASTIVANIWYHVGVTYDHTDNSMKIRVWDDNAGTQLGVNKTGTAGGNMSPDDATFNIGAGASSGVFHDGEIDEVVIFKDEALSDADIDLIRGGTYGVAGTIPIFMHHYKQMRRRR